jgi:L-ascorbate metabolism protein UlaG (beta-lactamase superfamily)
MIMQISYRWLGNAGFEFKFGKTILLVDPFLTRPNQSHVYFGQVDPDSQAIQTQIKGCNHILVSHTHFDHFMDVPEIARKTGALMHGSLNTCELACVMGVPGQQIHEINAYDEFSIDGVQVKVIPAAHPWIPGYTRGRLKKDLKPPLKLRDYRMDTCLSFLIFFHGKRILVWSSTRTEEAMPADMLICRAVSSESWYERILERVQPNVVIPSHWDDMFRPLSEPAQPYFSPPRLTITPIQRIDIGEFVEKINKVKPKCEVRIPERFCEEELF